MKQNYKLITAHSSDGPLCTDLLLEDVRDSLKKRIADTMS